MRNLDFLAKVLSSNNHYWIVSKRNEGTQNHRFKDSIILIATPNRLKINIDRKEILLTDLEDFRSQYMDKNIYLNEPYPPFQQGISFYDIYDGFPIDIEGTKIKEIMIKALTIKSDSLYEYKEQLKELLTPYNEINKS
jgi:hypothetical protein